jgi:hypothetical protein
LLAGVILVLYFIPKIQVTKCPTEDAAKAAKLCFDMSCVCQVLQIGQGIQVF